MLKVFESFKFAELEFFLIIIFFIIIIRFWFLYSFLVAGWVSFLTCLLGAFCCL